MEGNPNFRILGADGREYGPVAIDVVKRWIAEGRALAATPARVESQDSWRPLESFVEFGTEFAKFRSASTDPPRVSEVPNIGGAPGVVAAKSRIAAGILGILVGAYGIHRFYLGYFRIGAAYLALTVLGWMMIPLFIFPAAPLRRHPELSVGAMSVWMLAGLAVHLVGFVEGVLILCRVWIRTDAQGRPLKD
jgi:hypothetical protein